MMTKKKNGFKEELEIILKWLTTVWKYIHYLRTTSAIHVRYHRSFCV